jgi:hypothetical protein
MNKLFYLARQFQSWDILYLSGGGGSKKIEPGVP